MPYTTIKNPGIAQGFATLADALAPSAEREINADLAARRRDQMIAATGIDNQKLQQMRDQHAASVMLQSRLAENPDLTDPAVRADLMSILAGVDGGLQYGPKFATGATTYINPNTFSPDDFSNVLLGTGVVNGYDQTPSGAAANNATDLEKQRIAGASDLEKQRIAGASDLERQRLADEAAGARHSDTLNNQRVLQDMEARAAGDRNDDTLANALTRTRMDNDAAMQRHITPGANHNPNGRGAPLDVSPADTSKLWTLIQERLAATFPDVAPENMDPAVATALMPRVAELYQVSRNAELAIAQALAEVQLEQYGQDESWLPTGDTQRLRPKRTAGPATAAPADKPAAAAAPSAAAGQFQEGQTATGPNGEKIVFRNGGWVAVQ